MYASTWRRTESSARFTAGSRRTHQRAITEIPGSLECNQFAGSQPGTDLGHAVEALSDHYNALRCAPFDDHVNNLAGRAAYQATLRHHDRIGMGRHHDLRAHRGIRSPVTGVVDIDYRPHRPALRANRGPQLGNHPAGHATGRDRRAQAYRQARTKLCGKRLGKGQQRAQRATGRDFEQGIAALHEIPHRDQPRLHPARDRRADYRLAKLVVGETQARLDRLALRAHDGELRRRIVVLLTRNGTLLQQIVQPGDAAFLVVEHGLGTRGLGRCRAQFQREGSGIQFGHHIAHRQRITFVHRQPQHPRVHLGRNQRRCPAFHPPHGAHRHRDIAAARRHYRDQCARGTDGAGSGISRTSVQQRDNGTQEQNRITAVHLQSALLEPQARVSSVTIWRAMVLGCSCLARPAAR